MSATDQFEEDVLQHFFENATLPNMGDATGCGASSSAGSVDLSLHDAAIDDTTTDQRTNEVDVAGGDYAQYTRITDGRDDPSWTISNGSLVNADALQFPQMTSGNNVTVTYFGLSFYATSHFLQVWGQFSSGLAVSAGIRPEWAAGDFGITFN